ncbi:hypothetical protein KIW84_061566 [Lathyrus oleraceus]|uniref:Uncharacterized protein n=1 Tax=Pisum sativum TaxID=3888 RepID=A0A9D4W464_PEA|nr:hypothetical protein KIW84_061565 [Pisum sativum]KAI5395006.1 hypothetical protein KIW84_061566 [Pisum sativum]
MDIVACGDFHTCAVSKSEEFFTWGDGTHNVGLLGHGNKASHWIPKSVNGFLDGLQVVFVACGTRHSALATSNGKLFTFGDGTFGVLGHGDQESVLYPKEVQQLGGLRTIKVACGVWHTAAFVDVVFQSGSNVSSWKLFTWGGNIEMYGILDDVASGPIEAQISINSTMVGVETSTEGRDFCYFGFKTVRPPLLSLEAKENIMLIVTRRTTRHDKIPKYNKGAKKPTVGDFTNSKFPRNDTRLCALCSLDYLHERRNSKGHQKTQYLIQKFQIQFQNVLILTIDKTVQKGLKNGSQNEESMVVANLKELVLSKVLVEVLEEVVDFVPSEIRCVVIPTILEGKSLLLSSPSQPDRTLAYLLPFIQLLRRDREFGLNSKHPGAVALYASEEKVEQCQCSKIYHPQCRVKVYKESCFIR